MKQKSYLVIGVYEGDTNRRYADVFTGRTPEVAENKAVKQVGDELIIAGTIELTEGQELNMAS